MVDETSLCTKMKLDSARAMRRAFVPPCNRRDGLPPMGLLAQVHLHPAAAPHSVRPHQPAKVTQNQHGSTMVVP
eukprot:m.433936 g.433936  ORF g.433936 m.433936 type:complete len:74 (-) comp95675_c0_seq1:162-383(-)